jgi:peptide-methionine (S)-S-oxide reductase
MMITFDPKVVPYSRLVHLAMDRLAENKFLLNQVGNDKGTQYRHGVYYHNDEQKKIAQQIVGAFGADCVTEVLPATKFFIAEDNHQQYLLKGGQTARKGEHTAIRCYG